MAKFVGFQRAYYGRDMDVPHISHSDSLFSIYYHIAAGAFLRLPRSKYCSLPNFGNGNGRCR